MSKADLVEIIGQTSQIIGDELEHIHLNDKDKTPLASLSASTANLMVERYNVRDREPVMAAMLGMSDRLARVTKNEVYERLGAQARTAIEDVHRFKRVILQDRVGDCVEDLELLAAASEMSGAARVAILSWMVLMAIKLTGKKPAGMEFAVK
jgi:hypothetical protein